MERRPSPIGPYRGVVQPGNIDLAKRPIVRNQDGSISTVRSMSFGTDQGEVLVPTVSPDGRILNDDEAMQRYNQTGENLGIFSNPEAADQYAQGLHQSQDQYYARATGQNGMADLARIKNNVAKMAAQNAPVKDIDGYIASEGVTLDDVRGFKISPQSTMTPKDDRLPEERGLLRRIDDTVRGVADAATFGMSDELSAWLGSKTGIGGQEGQYDANLAAQRERDANGGYERLGGQLAGAVLMPGGFSKTALGAVGEGAALGAAYGFGSGEGGAAQRAESAGYGALAGGAIGGALRGVTNSLGNRAAAKTIPTNPELRKMAERAYGKADAAGLVIKPEGVKRLADSVVNDLAEFGYDPALQPGVATVLNRLNDLSDKNVTLKRLDIVRRVAGNVAKIRDNPSQQAIASKIIDKIDGYIDDLPDSDVLMGNARHGTEALKEARDLWGRLRRSEMVDTAAAKADLRASSTGSGGNVDNATRQNIRRLVENPRGMSAKERELAEVVVRGSKGQNALRLAGKLAPTGVVSGVLSGGAGYGLAGPVGLALPLVGAGAKAAADKMTMKNVERLSQIIRSGGKTGRDLAELARGGQLSIPQVQRLSKFASRFGIPLSEMAAILGNRAEKELSGPLELTVTRADTH